MALAMALPVAIAERRRQLERDRTDESHTE
jgi:hypothetical protein